LPKRAGAVGALAGYDNGRDRLDMRGPGLAIGLSLGAHCMHRYHHLNG